MNYQFVSFCKVVVPIMMLFLCLSADAENPGGKKVRFGAFEFPRFYIRESSNRAETCEKVMKQWRRIGVDRVFYHPRRKSPDAVHPYTRLKIPQLHKIAHEVGIELIPILNTMNLAHRAMKRKGVPPEQYMQIYRPSGTVGHRKEVSPLHPGVREAMRAAVRNWAQSADELHLTTIALDDEYGLRVSVRGAGLTDYNPAVIEYVKEEFDVEPVVPEPVEPGTIVALDDPTYLWLKATRNGGGHFGSASPLLKYHNRDLARVAHKFAPDLTVIQMPGAIGGELDAVTIELYQYGWGVHELASLVVYDRAVLAQSQQKSPNPIWPLIGWYQSLPFPDWIGPHVSLMGKLMAGRGVRAIDFASIPLPWDYHGGRDTRPFSAKYADFKPDNWFAGREDLRRAYQSLQSEIEQHADLLHKLEPAPMPVAVLFSKTTTMFQIGTRWPDQRKPIPVSQQPWLQSEAFQVAYPALLMSHLPIEMIDEEAIRNGELNEFTALVLVNCEYLPEDVHETITDFGDNGGVILADESTAFEFPGMKSLGVDFTIWSKMIQLGLRPVPMFSSGKTADIVRTRSAVLVRQLAMELTQRLPEGLPRRVNISDPTVVWMRRDNPSETGNSRHMLLFNTNLEETKEVQVQILDSPPESVLDITGDTAVRYDVTDDGGFEVRVRPGDWRILKFEDK